MKCEDCRHEPNSQDCIEAFDCDCAPSSCTVESIVRNVWNHVADEYNQWDSLGQDERDELIKVAVANNR